MNDYICMNANNGVEYPREMMSWRKCGGATLEGVTCGVLGEICEKDFLGGQSIPKFDYDLAKGVKLTFKKKYYDNIKKGILFTFTSPFDEIDRLDDIVNKLEAKEFSEYELDMCMSENCAKYLDDEMKFIKDNYCLSPASYQQIQRYAYGMAFKETDRATYQAMEALVHNLNTMQSRCGAQVDFDLI